MANFFSWILPRERKLFELLSEQSKMLNQAMNELSTLMEELHTLDKNGRKSRCNSIKSVWEKIESTKESIMDKISRKKTLESDEIKELSAVFDNAGELINSFSSRIMILGIERIDPHLIKMTNLVSESLGHIEKLMFNLRKPEEVENHYSKINKIKEKADESFNEAMSELFHFYKNPIDVLKYKELYDLLNQLSGRCKIAGQLVKYLSVKHFS